MIMLDNDQTVSDEETEGTHMDGTGEDYEKMKEEIHRMAKDLSIPLEEAARAVYSAYGRPPPVRANSLDFLNEIVPGMRGVTVRARVISVHSALRQDGESSYFFGMLGDSRTSVSFSCWVDFDFQPGEALVAQNVSVREYRDKLEIVINRYSFLSPLESLEGLIPPVEDGVPQAISELVEGSVNIDILGRIVDLSSSKVNVKGVEKAVLHGVLADRTGRIDFTCWGPMKLERDTCVRLIGGYLRSYRGSNRLNFDAGCILRELPSDVLPPLADLVKPRPARLSTLMESGISGPVEVRGTIVDLRPGSGFFLKCPECGRRAVKGQCTVHGRVEGIPDLSMRAIFDDGTGTAMMRGDRWAVESLLGQDLDTVTGEVKETMDPELVEGALKEKLIGRPFTLLGDPVKDDYGLTIFIQELIPGWDRERLMEEVSSLMGVVL